MRALLAGFVVVLVVAGVASAAKPVPVVSSVALATVNGVPAGGVVPALGDSLTFAVSVEKLAGWEYPMVDLQCYQDVNGDGTIDTSLLGPDVVFTWLDRPDAVFTLGGYSSIWTQRVAAGASPDAVCVADLDAYGWRGGVQSVRVLASDEFVSVG